MSIGSAREGGVNDARGSCGIAAFCYKAAMITSLMAKGLGRLAGGDSGPAPASLLVGLARIGFSP